MRPDDRDPYDGHLYDGHLDGSHPDDRRAGARTVLAPDRRRPSGAAVAHAGPRPTALPPTAPHLEEDR
ncbi:hypothetical protein RKE30_23435 [Streptomyces sp. Li-HN-5-11]|uniref:hypothetical protein n=1 Tax=Streptomyces sp. Li-HN-5-11 TaxID=3075432 RepID=UPI0028A86450|nr:hypothetical protein [Streptomyces sp. Li-HN-5-11]WNM33132.1 hypothetical protein RKE30_23435 [Streptomyces sp. Li-HN-5-11]